MGRGRRPDCCELRLRDPAAASQQAQPRADKVRNRGGLARLRLRLGHYGRLVKFLLLTAQRLDEAASLKFGDIINGTWRQVTNKSDRPHSLPLPPLVLGHVGRGGARDLVFPADSGGKIAAFSRWKGRLDRASGVSDWVIHDCRRSAASHMQDLGIRNDIVSAVLNHALPGVTAVYLRAELEKQKAEALLTWATAVERMVGGAAGARA